MTSQELTKLNLGLTLDARGEIILNSALEWLSKNTTIDVTDAENLPNCAKLFLLKYFDLQNLKPGVSSESIEGLSLSFNSSDTSAILWQLADELLGNYLKCRVRFVQASPKWR